MLENHTSKDFPFLDVPQNLRTRMIYYSALCRILTADDNPERDIERFLEPWHGPLRELASLRSLEAFRQPAVRVRYGKYCHYRTRS
jgi:exportin-7